MLMDNLKNIKLKKPDTKDYTLYGSIHMKCLERANLQEQKTKLVAQDWRWEQGLTVNGYEGTLQGDRNVLKWTMVMVTQLYNY